MQKYALLILILIFCVATTFAQEPAKNGFNSGKLREKVTVKPPIQYPTGQKQQMKQANASSSFGEAGGALQQRRASLHLDLESPQDKFTAFLKTRASSKMDQEIVFWWQGDAQNIVPGKAPQKLFEIEGFSIVNITRSGGGYEMRSREVTFFKDLDSEDEILETWINPFTGDTLTVQHDWHNLVSHKINSSQSESVWNMDYEKHGKDRICMLQTDEEAGEWVQYFFEAADMNDPIMPSVFVERTSTSIQAYPDWMSMGEASGSLLLQSRGHKLLGGAFNVLPEHIRDFVRYNRPEFSSTK